MDKPKSIIDIDIDFDEKPAVTINTDYIPSAIELTLPEVQIEKPVVPVGLEHIQNCPRCDKPLVKAIAINEAPSVSFLECPECGTLINTYRPTKYQAEFLRRPERYKMSAGGFGSGKSRVDIEDVIKHLLLIQGSRVAVTARTYPALQATFIKEFESMFPKKLVRSKNDQKHEVKLTNGSELIYRSFDDPTKLKSMNLTMAVIVEASDVPYSGFEMVQSRIRNMAATLPEVDMYGKPIMDYNPRTGEYEVRIRVDARHISLETNPDSGWVKSKFLLDAGVVHYYGEAKNEGYKFSKDPDPNKYVQIVSTSANPYLPPTYEAEQTRGKSPSYIMQFFKGSFNFSSNLVFPNFGACIVQPHPLPREYNEEGRRVLYYVIGLDYGINDPTHVIYGALSTETKKLYIFDELRINNSDIKTIAREHRSKLRINNINQRGLLMMPRFDGRSFSKRESNLKTIRESFEAEGLFFEPSFASHEARIIKMNSLINYGHIEVYSTCEYLIEEATNYKFKVDKRTGEPTSKPEDGKDHGVTALEFIVVELPNNLSELRLSAYIPAGTEFIHDKKYVDKETRVVVFDPLKEDDYADRSTSYSNNLIITGSRHIDNAYSIFDREGIESDEEEEADFGYSQLDAFIPGRG